MTDTAWKPTPGRDAVTRGMGTATELRLSANGLFMLGKIHGTEHVWLASGWCDCPYGIGCPYTLVRDADPLPDADGWEPKVGDRVKLVKDGLSTVGAVGMEGVVIKEIEDDSYPYLIELDEGLVYKSHAVPEQYRLTRAARDYFVSAVRPAPSGPVVEETEPKRSPLGWYYQADPKSRSVYRCKLGQAWERMEFTDLEPDAAELRFIADTIESAARQIGEAMEGK